MSVERRQLRVSGPSPVGPLESQVSSRGFPPPPGETLEAPGVPAGIPLRGGIVLAPETINNLGDVMKNAIQRALDKFSVYSQLMSMQNYDVIPVNLLANVAQRLDTIGMSQIGRRAFMICNPSAAQFIWVNKNDTVGVNNGIPIPMNGGSYMAAIHEHNAHWGLCTVNVTAITVWYS